MNLLQMSISGAILILVIVVIRALLINRLPKKTFLALWGVVLLRLLIPFSIPSVFSVYSLIGQNTTNYLEQTAISNFIPVIQEGPFELTEEILNLPTPSHISLWLIIWFVGTAFCTAFFVISYLRCHFEFSLSSSIQNDFTENWLKDHQLIRTISIRQSDRISTPLTYGIFKPIILMPKTTDWTNIKQLQYVLLHEYVHIRRFDSVTKLIFTVALCVHWFNPLVWVMYILFNRDIELACDERVVRLLGEVSKKDYALMLISMEAEKSGLMPFCNNFSKNSIEERIEAIMKIKKTSVAAITVALCLVGGTTVAFATSASTSVDDGIEIGIGMARKMSNDSPYEYSNDNGATWISETDYNAMYPQDEIVYWTYDEYKNWLDEYSSRIQGYVGSDVKYKDRNGNWVKWTQERVDTIIQRENEILDSIKNGAKVSKTINGDDSITMIGDVPSPENIGISYGAAITEENGEVSDLGTFSSEEGRLAAVKQYCEQQVRAGRISQSEANEIIKQYIK